jgi:hypothetical protein
MIFKIKSFENVNPYRACGTHFVIEIQKMGLIDENWASSHSGFFYEAKHNFIKNVEKI